MPEFILDHGTPDASKLFRGLDAFTQGYIECMFFTDTGSPDDAKENLEDATFADLAPSSLDAIKSDCAEFQELNADLLDQAYAMRDSYDAAHAGRDFWLTRNGHGAGFWSSDLGPVGDELSVRASLYGELYVMRGDDGRVYCE